MQQRVASDTGSKCKCTRPSQRVYTELEGSLVCSSQRKCESVSRIILRLHCVNQGVAAPWYMV